MSDQIGRKSAFGVHQSTALAAAVTALLAIVLCYFASTEIHGRKNSDTRAYERTLIAMSHGQSYYDASRLALVDKEGKAPSQVRAIRPPTTFLLLYHLPRGWWAGAAVLPIFVVLFSTYLLIAEISKIRAAVAVVLVTHFMWISALFLPLHAELWGLAAAMAGCVALSRKRWRLALALLVLATCTRELYGALFLVSLIVVPRSCWRAILCAGTVITLFYGLHAGLASQVLDSHGYQPPLNGTINLGGAITAFTFGFDSWWRLFGIGCMLVGLIMLADRSQHDRLALALLIYCVLMGVFTVFFGRTYWGLSFAPIVCAYAALLPVTRTKAEVSSTAPAV